MSAFMLKTHDIKFLKNVAANPRITFDLGCSLISPNIFNVYTHIHTHTHIYIYIYIYIYVCVCVCVCVKLPKKV